MVVDRRVRVSFLAERKRAVGKAIGREVVRGADGGVQHEVVIVSTFVTRQAREQDEEEARER